MALVWEANDTDDCPYFNRSLCLWSTAKKKPVFTLSLAHGVEEHPSETEGIVLEPRWISALACLRYSDVVASGMYSAKPPA